MKTSRFSLVLAPLLMVASVVACSNSSSVRPDRAAAGASSGSTGGASGGLPGGAAGDSSGAGGTSSGAAGTSGGAGASSGAAGTSGAAGEAGSTGAGGTTVQHTCDKPRFGSAMVELPSPGGTSYCMDVRLVSVGDYDQFWKAKGTDVSGQSARCQWNKNYAPHVLGLNDPPTSGHCEKWQYDPDEQPDAPVTCVDMCQAEAFCAWAGKRLCGRIGGGKLGVTDDKEAFASGKTPVQPVGESTNACSQGGKYLYASGESYVEQACDPVAIDKCHVQKTPPFDKLLALGYPTYEMIDACEPKAGSDYEWCTGVGRTYYAGGPENPAKPTCSPLGVGPSNGWSSGITFRCCAE